VKLEENPSAEPSVEEKNPIDELDDEHEQYRIKDPEEIKQSQQTQEEAPLVETKQPEPTIPNSTTEPTANKCMMGCSIM